MKIKLAAEGSIQIIMTTESVTVKDVEIIKAGVGKLLKNGKNRIILEVSDSDSLPDEVIRDIGFLDNIARELAGRIVIVSGNADLRKKLDVFAKPPLVLCYPDRKTALVSFAQPETLDEAKEKLKEKPLPGLSVAAEAAPPAPAAAAKPAAPPAPAAAAKPAAPPAPAAVAKPAASPAPAAVAKPAAPPAPAAATKPTVAPASNLSKEAVLATEVGDLGRVRRELAEMKRENQILHDQLIELVANRRETVDSGALNEKIRALELEVEKLLVPPGKA